MPVTLMRSLTKAPRWRAPHDPTVASDGSSAPVVGDGATGLVVCEGAPRALGLVFARLGLGGVQRGAGGLEGLVQLGVRGGRRGRGCAQIRDEITDAEVGLVAHRGDHWNLRVGGGAGDRLLVERHQVLQRAAAAPDDQQLGPAVPIGRLDRAANLARCFLALHANRVQAHAGDRPATPEHVQQIAYGRAGGRGDEGDACGAGWQRPLARGVEEALGFQFFLQFLEAALQQALARFLQAVDDELVLAAGLVQADPAACLHQHAVGRAKLGAQRGRAEHRAADLGAIVLQRKIQVPGGRSGEVGNLPLDHDARKARLEMQLDLEVELAGRVDMFRRSGHVGMINSIVST